MLKDVNIKNGERRYQILLKGSEEHVALVKNNVGLLAVGVSIFMLYPVYSFLIGERIQVLPVLLPFTNQNTDTGYYVNIAYQVFSCCMGLSGILANDVFLMELVSIYNLANGVLEFSCHRMSELTNDKKQSSIYRKMHFRNILMQTQDMNRSVG